jgi:hypothetical protein
LVSRVQGPARGTGTSKTSLQVTQLSNPTNGNVNILVFGSSETGTLDGEIEVSSISQAGVDWTRKSLNQYDDGNKYVNVEIWMGIIGASPSKTIDLTLTGAGGSDNSTVANVCEYTIAGPIVDQIAYNQGYSTSTDTGTTSPTGSQDQVWIGAVVVGGPNPQSNPTNDFTLLDGASFNSQMSLAMLEKIVSPGGDPANSGTTISQVRAWAGCIVTVEDQAWLSGWNYRQPHVITGATGAGTGYQKKIIVHSGAGTSSGDDVYLKGHCTSFPNDITFTASDGTTQLDFWIETPSGDPATVWVEVSADLGSNQTIYIYYGKSGQSSLSNGTNTFPLLYCDWEDGSMHLTDLFDNVAEQTTSEVTLGGSYQVTTDGSVKVLDLKIDSGTNKDNSFQTKNSIQDNVAIRVRAKMVQGGTSSNGHSFILFSHANPGTQYQMSPFYYNTNQFWRITKRVGGTWTDDGTYSESWASASSGYKILETTKIGSSHTVYKDGTQIAQYNSSISGASKIAIGVRRYDTYTVECYYDWILVRKFVSPEPANSTWGSEETGGATQINVSDTGSGSDVPGMQASLSLSDSGSGADVLTSIGIPVSDTGSGSDVPSMQASVPASDSGSGTDSPGLTASLGISDSGSGSDAPGLTAQISSSDTGAGTDVWQLYGVFGYLTVGAYSGNDWTSNQLMVCKFTSPSDCGPVTKIRAYLHKGDPTVHVKACIYADNNGAPGALLATSDEVVLGTTDQWVDFTINYSASPNTVYWLGIFGDNWWNLFWDTNGSSGQLRDRISDVYPTFPDPFGTAHNTWAYQMSIYACYTPTVVTMVYVSDSGLGTDTQALQASIPTSDAGSGSDSPTVQAQVSPSDTGQGAETASLTCQISISDSGTGSETISAGFYVTVTDSGSGTELWSLQAQVSAADSGVGSDSVALTAQLSITDSGLGSELVQTVCSLTVSDTGHGVDAVSQLQAQLLLADTGAGSETLQLQCSFTVADSGVGTDIASISVLGAAITIVHRVTLKGEKGVFVLKGEKGQLVLKGEKGQVTLEGSGEPE